MCFKDFNILSPPMPASRQPIPEASSDYWVPPEVAYENIALRASPAVLSIWPCENIFHIQV
jgi:hypothetical protein